MNGLLELVVGDFFELEEFMEPDLHSFWEGFGRWVGCEEFFQEVGESACDPGGVCGYGVLRADAFIPDVQVQFVVDVYGDVVEPVVADYLLDHGVGIWVQGWLLLLLVLLSGVIQIRCCRVLVIAT